MASSPFPDFSADEAARLRSLRSVELLPALTEPVFNEFVALTARIFNLPISLISVVEETDVYYPANVGMPENKQQPRAEALCATAIAQAQAVVYHDLALETHPELPPEARRAAETNGLRFYAGALLRLPDQRPLGTLCVIDRAPRTFTPDEQRILEILAALVSRTVAVRHLCRLHPETGDAQWARLSAELEEEVQALNALVRYLTARHGTLVPVPAAFLTQVESRLRDLQALLEAYHPGAF
ncbi:GAF domain-containing protein [Hymenobacter convexus]|uniref:GAF domain-containing protein n=1 Tax=Hymenobacter sp. CA1UV-4 TaxID=3063782 RepID=UPI0027123571|nr:GAF domain-containing protein [Hymenobacter sp. CA1UV-4]MDO7853512.1 GAF domain-containing protein [Hymenobacter sp. CA1UV-4]